MSNSYSWNPFNASKDQTNIDIELLKSEVGKHFPFYDVKFNANAAAFFCRVEEEFLEDKFDSLRNSLSEKGFIPMIRYDKGEYIIQVIRKPKVKKKPVWINIVLLIATIITTTIAGAIQWAGLYDASYGEIFEPFYFLNGFFYFSIPLLLILGVHEFGHYYISKRHKLDTSLPYFIPLPPPFILGTFGAIISTYEPIPKRKTLLDVGASGPIFGFLVAIPVAIIGLFLMQQNPILPPADSTGGITIFFPLVLQGLSSFFTIPENAMMHPTLFAAWVGFFVTSLNLLPIGQLDGGHVVRALFKDYQKYISWAVVIIILGLGMFHTGWLFIAVFVLFLIGTQHRPPLNEISPLDRNRIIIGILALIIFILCFAPLPMSGST